MISSHARFSSCSFLSLRVPRCAWACRGAGASSFAWHETKLEAVRAVLREDGLSDDDIDAKLYYGLLRRGMVSHARRAHRPPAIGALLARARSL